MFAMIDEVRTSGATQTMGQLSPREHEVAVLVARGWSNKEVARELGLVVGTVKVHMNRIIKKLNVKTRYQVMMTMMRLSSREP
jgi:DNA-binding NarL/FixJ family response regulator